MRAYCLIALSLGCLFAGMQSIRAADSKAPTFTDAKSAGIDFALQGEYVGELETDNGRVKVGVQIIALGDGAFKSVGYHGGLPGEGWTQDEATRSAEGVLENGVVRFVDGDIVGVLKDDTLTVKVQDKELGQLKKVHRESPTMGMKPPAGAIVLFDGTSAAKFENGELVEGNLLGATNCSSLEKFGDHRLHIEFRTPFMPQSRGQARGNSGVYVQGRFEVQVLDSFGLEGKDNECGGIYSIVTPRVNMCFPPLSWQTYDIDFTAARYDDSGNKQKNARITVRHNGVVIHKDVELTHGTPGRHPEGADPDSLFLQNHGNPVVYRNIWVVKK